jgi:hypothetical protein
VISRQPTFLQISSGICCSNTAKINLWKFYFSTAFILEKARVAKMDAKGAVT